MSGSLLAIIIIPIVAFLTLIAWLSAVLYASRRPGGKQPGSRPRWHVSGGTFQGDPRQMTPRRDATPPEAADYEGSPRDEDS